MFDGLSDDISIPFHGRGGVFKRPTILLDGHEDDLFVPLAGLERRVGAPNRLV